jgi:hypothetical protein
LPAKNRGRDTFKICIKFFPSKALLIDGSMRVIERDTMVEWDVPIEDFDPQELERMEEEAVRNVVDKIGESVVWGPQQEVYLLVFDDWKQEYVRIEIGEEMVEEIDRRDSWTSRSVLFLAQLTDLNPTSRV